MSQKRAQKVDVEKLAAEAKAKRVKECGDAIQKVLTQYECRLFTALGVGQQTIELRDVAGLPVLIQLGSTK